MLHSEYNLNCSNCGLGGSIGVSSPKVKVGAKLKFGISTKDVAGHGVSCMMCLTLVNTIDIFIQ